MPSPPRIITVFGATGNQGGSVVRSLLGNKSTFQVRATTRNPSSEASKALSKLGATVIKVDGWNQEDLIEAFKGSWAAFVNINSDDPVQALTDQNGHTEFDFGKGVVDSASRAGVKHLVFSTGPPATELTDGRVKVSAMDSKFKIEKHARSNGLFSTVTGMYAGIYLENFLIEELAPVFGGFPWIPDSDGYLTYRAPSWGGREDVPWIDIRNDFGDLVHGILLDPEKWNGRNIQGVSDIASFSEMTETFQEVTGKKSRYLPLLPSWEAFQTYGDRGLESIKGMFGFVQINKGQYFGKEPTESRTAAALKEAAAHACGKKGQDVRLMTVADWFRRAFGTDGAQA